MSYNKNRPRALDEALHMEVLPRLEDTDTVRDTEDTLSIVGTMPSNMEDDLEDFEIPEGLTLPLNSKRISAARIKRLAAELDVPTTALADEVRQMLGERLREMGHDPANVQVVIQGDGDVENLYLVDDLGIIRASKGNVATHVHEVHEHVTQPESSKSLRTALHEARDENQRLMYELTTVRRELSNAGELIADLKEEIALSREQLSEVQRSLNKECQKSWKQKCEMMLAHEEVLEEKEATIAALQHHQVAAESRQNTVNSGAVVNQPVPTQLDGTPLSRVSGISRYSMGRGSEGDTVVTSGQIRRGKAPPVECFSGEDADMTWDDWLATLERAATWNAWNEGEKLLQLAGYLKGKALQEWNLMEDLDKGSYNRATATLKGRMDHGSMKLAAQDFRHAAQRVRETVAEFIHHLEKTFRRAYGKEAMTTETKDALLYGQLQEGLRLEIMQVPAVSGAQSYAELCVAAKNEQCRQDEMLKRQQYSQGRSEDVRRRQQYSQERMGGQPNQPPPANRANSETRPADTSKTRCYICQQVAHLKKDCPQGRSGSRPSTTQLKRLVAALLQSAPKQEEGEDPLAFLESSSEEDVIRQVRVRDTGSLTQCVKLFIQDVPVYGIIDSGQISPSSGVNCSRRWQWQPG